MHEETEFRLSTIYLDLFKCISDLSKLQFY